MGVRAFVYNLLTHPLAEKAVAAFLNNSFFSLQGYTHVPLSAPDKIKAGLFWGIYEYPERFLISKYLPKDRDVVELGSSLGIVTRSVLKRIDESRRVISIEANSELKPFWLKNIEEGKFPQRAFWENGMISYCPDDFFCAGADNLSGKASRNPCPIGPSRLSLEKVLERFSLTGPYSLVMDIEGMEFTLLKQEPETLQKAVFVCAELHGSEKENLDFHAAMLRLGFFLRARKHTVFAWAKGHASKLSD